MAMMDGLGDDDRSAGETTEELFRRYYRPVVAFFSRRGFSLEDSRDLAQETFVKIFKSRDGFRGESSIETWLFQIAGNLYKNALRSRSTLKRDAQEVPLEAPGVEPEASGASPGWGEREEDPLDSMLTEERAKVLRSAMDGLSPQMRQAVVLRVDGDLKYREIAEVMSVSIETVKAHLYQARQHLRDRLADYFTDIEF